MATVNITKRISENHILAISIGLVYLWFGALKYFPDLSPAESLAKDTIHILTFGLIPENVTIILLAIWETIVGLGLILNIYRRPMIVIALAHLALTFTPLILFPDLSFNGSPFYLTIVGQYIFKNIIIIAALLTLYRMSGRSRILTGSI